MTQKEFRKHFESLMLNFSRFLSEKQILFFYKYLQDIPEAEFEKVVDYIIREDTFFPPISRLLEVSREIKRKEREKEIFEEVKRREEELKKEG